MYIVIFFALIFVIILIAITFLFVCSSGTIQPYKDSKGAILDKSIAEIRKLDIGGIQQGMIIKGQNEANPVLLFLHGGPGSPEYLFIKSSGLDLEAHFTVCWWDQRGAGMSYSKDIKPDSMTLEQMIADTVEVTKYLRQRFKQDKIFLSGHSWGTFLGIHTVQRYPEFFRAYVGIGQVANQLQSEKDAYEYMLETAKKLRDNKLVKQLEKHTLIDAKSITMEYLKVRTLGMNKLGIGFTHRAPKVLKDLVWPLISSSEYTLGQKVNFLKGTIFSSKHLFQRVLAENFSETIPRLEIPVYMIQGKYDYQVSYKYAKEYFELLDAPIKKFYTFKHSAHCPPIEQPVYFLEIIKRDILAENQLSSQW